ncbi:Coenzyme F420 hydrogenase/dehydrogenase, beta subunit C-terminal domain [Treponema brennaborense]|uniref:4Fe-4S ferredoxin iron-sulfur binding domain-containing protein n=1 Tax=Treponema brennaborense (strain DSM 12168 / CIP 105900 / DD5/3) TaxID=906968 RepID=F4LIK7_TREBD|nr:Coenzyme F420 hydrogenase/dehydrogenase, beta subunit C-terminal domain [Treponema brennaborense]AEE17232.1 4Fe-4S ferredoxin iron-sulfur binding domain-containing protein [Treponema brennaborense DSM 12168]
MNVSTVEKNKCFGCGSCFQACPKNAIRMEADSEGFLFPKVDEEKCIDCGLCVKKCPSLSPVNIEKDFVQECYSAVYLADDVCKNSASGGAFASFAINTLKDVGVVFGCAYDDDLNAIHVKIDSLKELSKLQGSKYVSSDTKNTFIETKEILDSGKKVLYSGRPCQITGLLKFLGRQYDNLVTVDLVCHGVPSQLLFSKYLEWLGTKIGGKIIYYSFRDKDAGGWSCGGKFKTKTKTKTMEASCDPYYASFLRGETYRLSCYECPFANAERIGDLSICDFWGVEKFYPEIDTSKGVSGIIVNSGKGKKLLEKCADSFSIKEISLEELKKQNTNLNHPTPMPEKRKTVYKDSLAGGKFTANGIKYASSLEFYLRQTALKYMPKKLKKIIKTVLGEK